MRYLLFAIQILVITELVICGTLKHHTKESLRLLHGAECDNKVKICDETRNLICSSDTNTCQCKKYEDKFVEKLGECVPVLRKEKRAAGWDSWETEEDDTAEETNISPEQKGPAEKWELWDSPGTLESEDLVSESEEDNIWGLESKEEKDIWNSESTEEKKVWDSASKEKKDTWNSESTEEKKVWDSASKEEKNTWDSESREEKNVWNSESKEEKNTWDSESREEKNPQNSESKEEKNTWDSESREEKNVWNSESKEEKNTWDSESREEENPQNSESKEEKNTWDSESREEKTPWDSESKEEAHVWRGPETKEKKDEWISESEEETDVWDPESKEKKDKWISESEEEKYIGRLESKKNTHNSESKETKDIWSSESKEEKWASESAEESHKQMINTHNHDNIPNAQKTPSGDAEHDNFWVSSESIENKHDELESKGWSSSEEVVAKSPQLQAKPHVAEILTGRSFDNVRPEEPESDSWSDEWDSFNVELNFDSNAGKELIRQEKFAPSNDNGDGPELHKKTLEHEHHTHHKNTEVNQKNKKKDTGDDDFFKMKSLNFDDDFWSEDAEEKKNSEDDNTDDNMELDTSKEEKDGEFVCQTDAECHESTMGEHSKCENAKCVCKKDPPTTKKDNVCYLRKKIIDPCDKHEDCYGIPGEAWCEKLKGHCTCKALHVWNEAREECIPLQAYATKSGYECVDDRQCTHTFGSDGKSTCSVTGQCVCEGVLFKDMCYQKRSLNNKCALDVDCQASLGENAFCGQSTSSSESEKVCLCEEGKVCYELQTGGISTLSIGLIVAGFLIVFAIGGCMFFRRKREYSLPTHQASISRSSTP